MGHIRLGYLPHTKAWREVFQALVAPCIDTGEVAGAVSRAAQKQFNALKGDEGVNYCFWTLSRVLTAARTGAFVEELRKLGIDCEGISSGIDFVHRVSRAVEQGLSERQGADVFVRMAELSLREVLSTRIAEEARSLFGTDVDDIESACRRLSTRNRFGEVARGFFSAFMSRSIHFFVDKEISNHVGPGQPCDAPGSVLEFQRQLERYCAEASRIVEDYSGGWFSLHNWETNNNISEQATVGFTAYALEKMNMELREGQGR